MSGKTKKYKKKVFDILENKRFAQKSIAAQNTRLNKTGNLKRLL